MRPPPSARGLKRFKQWVAYQLSAKRVRLDELGSFAWKRLDGRRTVGEVARELREEFGEAGEPAEERLGLLVRQLRGEEFLAYPGWDEPHGGTI